jgi:hypothetical protein
VVVGRRNFGSGAKKDAQRLVGDRTGVQVAPERRWWRSGMSGLEGVVVTICQYGGPIVIDGRILKRNGPRRFDVVGVDRGRPGRTRRRWESDAGSVAESFFFGSSQSLSQVKNLRLEAGIARRRKRNVAGSGAASDGDKIRIRSGVFQSGAIGVWFVNGGRWKWIR